MGGKVLVQYALLGQWDFLNVVEAPDELVMSRIATMSGARGTLKTRTLTAIDNDDLIEVLEQE